MMVRGLVARGEAWMVPQASGASYEVRSSNSLGPVFILGTSVLASTMVSDEKSAIFILSGRFLSYRGPILWVGFWGS